MRRLSHPNVLKFMGILYKDKRLILVTGRTSHTTLKIKAICSYTILQTVECGSIIRNIFHLSYTHL